MTGCTTIFGSICNDGVDNFNKTSNAMQWCLNQKIVQIILAVLLLVTIIYFLSTSSAFRYVVGGSLSVVGLATISFFVFKKYSKNTDPHFNPNH